MSKDRHEANLRIGKLQPVTDLRGAAEQDGFHPHRFLHCPLVGEFELQKMGPFLGHGPWSSLVNLVGHQAVKGMGKHTTLLMSAHLINKPQTRTLYTSRSFGDQPSVVLLS
jgi:hypothetical protein